MRRSLAVLALLTLTAASGLPAPAGAAGLQDLDAQNGFLNARFGDRLEEFHGLTPVKTFGAIRMFVSTVDRKSFRKARLEGVGYLFYGDQLYAVVLAPWSESDAERLLQVFRESYGDPYEASASPQWWGKNVGLQWMENPAGGPPYAVFLDRRTVQSIEKLGTSAFEILDRLD